VPTEEQTTSPADDPPIRLQDGEQVTLALRRTSWVATFAKIATLGLFVPWWRAGWFVLTDRRLIVKFGILNKSEIALPLHFVQDTSVHRSWLGIGRVLVSTAGGDYGNLRLYPLKASDARRLADTIILQAKRVALDHRPAQQGADDTTDALARLGELREKGILTEDEFAQQKARLLRSEF
jgi:uncharacterized membrane protein YdbT with pleckstrin-like domain